MFYFPVVLILFNKGSSSCSMSMDYRFALDRKKKKEILLSFRTLQPKLFRPQWLTPNMNLVFPTSQKQGTIISQEGLQEPPPPPIRVNTLLAVLTLAWVSWVPWNPSILRGGFSNPSIFEKESIEIQYFEKFSNYIVFAGSSFALLHT